MLKNKRTLSILMSLALCPFFIPAQDALTINPNVPFLYLSANSTGTIRYNVKHQFPLPISIADNAIMPYQALPEGLNFSVIHNTCQNIASGQSCSFDAFLVAGASIVPSFFSLTAHVCIDKYNLCNLSDSAVKVVLTHSSQNYIYVPALLNSGALTAIFAMNTAYPYGLIKMDPESQFSFNTIPVALATSPGGDYIYVVNHKSAGPVLEVLSALSSTNPFPQIVATLPLPYVQYATWINTSLDGKLIYISSFFDNEIYIVNIEVINGEVTAQYLGEIKTDQPQIMMASPDGSILYVSTGFSLIVDHLNTISNPVQVISSTTFPLPGTTFWGMAISPDGGRLYLSACVDGNGVIKMFDTTKSSEQLTDFLNIPNASPFILVLSPDGSKLYALSFNPQEVLVIDTTSAKVISTIPLENFSPFGMSILPDGSALFITSDSNDYIEKIDLTNNQVTALPSMDSPGFVYANFIN
ncbi:MAG: YncE family protein [Gammaproteobacteria bacterium]|nr:YncE family protein [Gammaproteobacteria bacterium]